MLSASPMEWFSLAVILVWGLFMLSAWRKYDGPMIDRLYYRWAEFLMNFKSGQSKGLEMRKNAIEEMKSKTVGGGE